MTSLGPAAGVIYENGLPYVVDIDQDDEFNQPNEALDIGSPPAPLQHPHEFSSLISRPTARCRRLINIGGLGCTKRYEGNKDVCLDPPVLPPRGRCLVYSFGVADDITFEDSLVTFLDCKVHMFDPTVQMFGWNFEKVTRGRFFHALGVSTRRLSVPFPSYPLDQLMDQLGHRDAVIHYLKMDIEGGEWEVLRYLVRNNLLKKVVQLQVELHSLDLRGKSKAEWLLALKDRYEVLLSLETIGFRRVRVQPNNHFLCRVDFRTDPPFFKTSEDVGLETKVIPFVAEEEDVASAANYGLLLPKPVGGKSNSENTNTGDFSRGSLRPDSHKDGEDEDNTSAGNRRNESLISIKLPNPRGPDLLMTPSDVNTDIATQAPHWSNTMRFGDDDTDYMSEEVIQICHEVLFIRVENIPQ